MYSTWPPPEHPCPSLEDEDWLAEAALPLPSEPIHLIRVVGSIERFVRAGSYCRDAAEELE